MARAHRWHRLLAALALAGWVVGWGSPVGVGGGPAAAAPLAQSGAAADAPPFEVETATSAFQGALDPALQTLARTGGDELVEVRLVTQPGVGLADWAGLVQAVPRAVPDEATGLPVWYGRIRAGDLARVASLGFLVRADYVPDEGPVPRFRDPDQKPPAFSDDMRARLVALRDRPPASPNAPVTTSGWWDIGPGHSSSAAWAKGYTGQGVRVANIDSGTDFCHPDLYGTWATYDASFSRNVSYNVYAGTPPQAVTVPDYYDYYDGWPVALSPFSNFALVFDWVVNGQLTDLNTFAEGYSTFADTRATGTGSRISLGGQVYTTTGTANAANPIYHVGYHPDLALAQIWNERIAVLVVDEDGDGTYESVYTDLNANHDFRDDKRASREDPVACWDADGDGYYDVSGGMVYFIADGRHWPQMMDWWWDPTSLGLPVPGSGDLVAFMYDDPYTGGGGHGTLTAGNIAGQGRIDGDPSLLGSDDARPPWKPSGVGGMVQGAGKDVRLITIGDVYVLFTLSTEDAWYFSTFGMDGFGDTDDGAQITSNSFGESDVDNDEWDPRSRLLTRLNTAPTFRGYPNTFGARVAHIDSTGNGGSGYGTTNSPNASTAIQVGASTQFGSTHTFEPIAGPGQVVWGDVVSFSDRGPTAAGHLAPHVTGDGAFAAGAVTLNAWGDGWTAWETWGGTSRSTPVAAGNLALVYQAWKQRTGQWPTWAEARQLLMSGATDQRYDVLVQGAGAVNADYATDIAAGRYGLQLSPEVWYPGDFRGAEYLAFTNLIPPGGSDLQTFTARNYSNAAVSADLSATRLVRTGEFTFTVTSDFRNQSPYATGRPDYLFDVSRYAPGGVPAGTDLMVAELVNPFEYFEPTRNNDPTDNSVWRVLWYRYTDLNADGNAWTDLNDNGVVNAGELDSGEIIRMNYGYSAGNYKQASVRDPLGRWGDGLLLGLQHRTLSFRVVSTPLTLRVSFYRRVPWSWLSFDQPSLTAGPGGSATFNAQVQVPANTPYGLYEGEIQVRLPGANGFAARTSLIPVVINVGFEGDARAAPLQFGGTPRSNTLYDNGRVAGPLDWTWRPETGDWRFFFFDQQAPAPPGTRLLVRTEWADPAPYNDIDTVLLAPISDTFGLLENFSLADPATFGPYRLDVTARSQNAYVGGGVWAFDTRTGRNVDYVSGPLREGLNALLDHAVLFQGDQFEVPFTQTASVLELSTERLGPTDQLAYQGYFNDRVSIGANIAHTGGITLEVFGLNSQRVDPPPGAIGQDPTNDNPCDWDSGGVYTQTLSLPADAAELGIYLDVGANDLDLFLGYDGNGDGSVACPGEIAAASTASAGIDDFIRAFDPPAGNYLVVIQGWSVRPDPSPFTWYYEHTVRTNDLAYRNASLALGPGQPASFELYNAPGSCDAAAGDCTDGLLVLGIADVPDLLTLPITVTDVGANLSASAKTVNTPLAYAGQTLTYTVRLTNTSVVSGAVGVLVTDTLPLEIDFGSLVGGGAVYDPASRSVHWAGDVPQQSSNAFTYTAIVNTALVSGTVIANTAQVNNGRGYVLTVGPASTTVLAADLRASTKAVDRALAGPGQVLAYSVVLRNTGPAPAPGARLTDTLPAATTFVPGSAGGGAVYDPALHAVLWTGTVPAGGDHTVTYHVRLNAPLANGLPITNTAQVATGAGELAWTNTTTTTVAGANLSASTKRANVPMAQPGQVVTFTLNLLNTGQVAAQVMLTDTLPPGLALAGPPVLLSGPGAVLVNGNTLTWAGTLDAAFNNQAVVRYAATVSSAAAPCQLLTNLAYLSDDQGQTATAGAVVRVEVPSVTCRYLSFPFVPR